MAIVEENDVCPKCGEYEYDCRCVPQSTDKPCAYTVIASGYEDTVSDRVTNHLEEGWELYGHLRVIQRPKALQIVKFAGVVSERKQFDSMMHQDTN